MQKFWFIIFTLMIDDFLFERCVMFVLCQDNRPVLTKVAERGLEAVVDVLLEYGAEVDACDYVRVIDS